MPSSRRRACIGRALQSSARSLLCLSTLFRASFSSSPLASQRCVRSFKSARIPTKSAESQHSRANHVMTLGFTFFFTPRCCSSSSRDVSLSWPMSSLLKSYCNPAPLNRLLRYTRIRQVSKDIHSGFSLLLTDFPLQSTRAASRGSSPR